MLFNSLTFLFFFPVVVALYFLLPYRFRWLFLLLASYYFYMCWRPMYVLILIGLTVVDYFVGLQMGKQATKAKRKKYLYISLACNLGLLFLFKYFNFFSGSLQETFNYFHIDYTTPVMKLLLPLGISFHIFQTLSYTIDIYKGIKAPEKHFGVFALYVAFFPQLVAGPIERSTSLMPQFHKNYDFDYERVTSGLRIMAWGFFKKLVIADRLAIVVNQVYNNPTEYSGIPLILATYCFAFQIYCDFSGYSDIAIGSARVMGYTLMDNFRQPYLATSMSDFWKRWHISLSSWFRDYVYIPLGGNRVPRLKHYSNLFITFLLSGLWHGANWTFIVWGALHGFYVIFALWSAGARERLAKIFNLDGMPRVHTFLKILITFHLVCFAWIFFRANSFADAWYIVTHIVDFTATKDFLSVIREPGRTIELLGLAKKELLLALVCIGFMLVMEFVGKEKRLENWLAQKPIAWRWSFYVFLLAMTICFGKFVANDFIYFVF